MGLSTASSLPQFISGTGGGLVGGGGDTCAGLAGEGETGESPPREPACMWRVWPSVAVSIRAVHGLREIL